MRRGLLLTVSMVGGVLLVWLMVLPFVGPNAQAETIAVPFEACTNSIQGKALGEKIDLDMVHRIDALCYDHVYWLRLLDDFQIRRSKVLQQNSSDFILLWMVVAITISGVVLAGLQLLGSYQLASLGKGDFAQSGELSFEARGNMSAKTSVTGLLILVVSFAFFLVYVGWVYPVREVRLDPLNPGEQEIHGQSTKPPAEPSPMPMGRLVPFASPGGVVGAQQNSKPASAPESTAK